jgi:lipopolysaccharide export system permease protein
MVSRTLIRYFGMRFLGAVMSVFLGIFVLIVLVDYIELMRRAADVPNLSPGWSPKPRSSACRS